MPIERIGVTQRWCDAAIFNGIVFLAGHVAETTEGRPLAEQTAEVLALLEETLESAGCDKTRILSVQIFLTDISKIAEMNAVWDAWSRRVPRRPARRSRPSWQRRATTSRSRPWRRRRVSRTVPIPHGNPASSRTSCEAAQFRDPS